MLRQTTQQFFFNSSSGLSLKQALGTSPNLLCGVPVILSAKLSEVNGLPVSFSSGISFDAPVCDLIRLPFFFLLRFRFSDFGCGLSMKLTISSVGKVYIGLCGFLYGLRFLHLIVELLERSQFPQIPFFVVPRNRRCVLVQHRRTASLPARPILLPWLTCCSHLW